MTAEPEKGNLEGSGQLVILHFNLCHDNWNSIWQWFWPCLLVLLGWDFCWIIYTDGTRLIQHAQQKFLRGALGPTLVMLSNDFSVLSSVSKLICKRQLPRRFCLVLQFTCPLGWKSSFVFGPAAAGRPFNLHLDFW